MRFLLVVLMFISLFAYAGDKKEPEPTVEVKVRDIKILMQIAEEQKQTIDDLQDTLREAKHEIEALEEKCTF